MTFYIRNGNIVNLTDESAINIQRELSPGNYIVKQDPQSGQFYLEETDKFVSLPKYYGDLARNVDRIHRTFETRPASTGIMLVGEKGSGKTLLAKELSIYGYSIGMPTLLVNQDWRGDSFNKFIQDIDQAAIIIFDEFEKIYTGDKQDDVLTLFDGVYPSKKLFVISCNDKYKINSHMRNRPGRFFYFLEFTGLEVEFIREYCADNGIGVVYTDQICNFSSLFSNFNFDMLKALVEEMNRYGECPQDAIKFLNARPENDSGNVFDVLVFVKGIKVTNSLHPTEFNKNPLVEREILVNFYMPKELQPKKVKPIRGKGLFEDDDDDDDDDNNYRRIKFVPGELVTYDVNNGSFMFRQGDYELHLVRKAKATYDWSRVF